MLVLKLPPPLLNVYLGADGCPDVGSVQVQVPFPNAVVGFDREFYGPPVAFQCVL